MADRVLPLLNTHSGNADSVPMNEISSFSMSDDEE
jgi:hypothetical protein